MRPAYRKIAIPPENIATAAATGAIVTLPGL